MTSKPIALAAAIAIAVLATLNQAAAHARLKSAQPAAGSTGASPTAIVLEFSEGLVPRLSGIALADAAGHPVKLAPTAAGATASGLSAPVPQPLAPGSYTVTWHAVSVDTHRTKGSFRFTVAK